MKKAAAMILAALTAVSLAACGLQSAETSVQKETTSAETSASDEA